MGTLLSHAGAPTRSAPTAAAASHEGARSVAPAHSEHDMAALAPHTTTALYQFESLLASSPRQATQRQLLASLAPAQPVLQAAWATQDGGQSYQQDVPVDGRTWSVRLAGPLAEVDDELGDEVGDELAVAQERRDLYQFTEGPVQSAWLSAAEHAHNGHPPPLGARFQEQRRVGLDDGQAQAEQDSAGADKYAYEASALKPGVPLVVKQAHAALGQQVAQLKAQRAQDKALLDTLLYGEFQRIKEVTVLITTALQNNALGGAQRGILEEHFSAAEILVMVNSRAMNAKQAETLAAGLRYKRVYEHEQNLLTVNRRSRQELDAAVDSVADQYELDLEVEIDDDASTEAVSALDVDGSDYVLGIFYFGAARFERVADPLIDGGSAVFQHRETGEEYVQDIADSFVPRYVSRAIRYEDAMAILADQAMPTKMGFDDTISGKEATDYGAGFTAGDEISYDQKVIGQIRGYGRFLSATSSKRMATSTSRGTYDSPFGKVEIDLAKTPKEDFSEAHSEDAMQDIFDVDDLGAAEFIPKHLDGEQAEVKAARDAYRAREVVVQSPPVNAVRTVPRGGGGEAGLVIVGITGSADEASVRASLADWAPFISFIEVNTTYKRTIDEHNGNTAFVSFKGIDSIDTVIAELRQAIGAGRVSKIRPDAYVTTTPSSTALSAHQNPEQRDFSERNTRTLERYRSRLQALIDALRSAHGAKLHAKLRRHIHSTLQTQENALQTLAREAAQGMTPDEFANLTKEAARGAHQQCFDLVDGLQDKERFLPELADLRRQVGR